MPGDVGDEAFCEAAVEATIKQFGRLDILVNNAAEQHEIDDIRGNRRGADRAHVPHQRLQLLLHDQSRRCARMEKGGSIINTASITAYQGHKTLLDYSATKGAIVALTRSLSEALVDEGIRVNAVAPGPIWTPLIPASFEAEARRQARRGRADGAARPAERSRALLRLSGERGCLLYQRPGAASERRQHGRVVKELADFPGRCSLIECAKE